MLSDRPLVATIPAADVERAKSLYVETLGMRVIRETPAEWSSRAARPSPSSIRRCRRAANTPWRAGWSMTSRPLSLSFVTGASPSRSTTSPG